MKKRQNTKGFSLPEVVMAIAVVSIGILGVFSLIILNIKTQVVNRGYLVASMLAQEGLELVRNQRDYNWLSFEGGDLHDWDEYITYNPDPPNIHNGAFTASFEAADFDYSCSDISNDCAILFLDANNMYTTADTGNPTPYRRLIEIDEVTTVIGDPRPEYFRVRSIVQWTERNNTHQYVAETYLYNWRGLN